MSSPNREREEFSDVESLNGSYSSAGQGVGVLMNSLPRRWTKPSSRFFAESFYKRTLSVPPAPARRGARRGLRNGHNRPWPYVSGAGGGGGRRVRDVSWRGGDGILPTRACTIVLLVWHSRQALRSGVCGTGLRGLRSHVPVRGRCGEPVLRPPSRCAVPLGIMRIAL